MIIAIIRSVNIKERRIFMENIALLVEELIKMPDELSWVEFKHNNYDPKMIGEDISALANAATLHEKNCAYMVWGIHDKTHEIVGTDHNLQNIKKGNQELEGWLRGLLSENADFTFDETIVQDKRVCVLSIEPAISFPVRFEKIPYIRVGSYTKKLKDHPALESKLWDKIKNTKFETQYAKTDLKLNEVLQIIDYSYYFDLCKLSVPTDIDGVAHYLLEEGIIVKQDNGLYSVTNLGAVLFAKNINIFSRISRKALRIVQYEGSSRLLMKKENIEQRGYVAGFEYFMKYIDALIPTEEIITEAVRDKKSAYPSLAIREAVANALIHQDLSVTGAGPVVEVFDNRIEITNPGKPLVDINRIVDNPPKSRNEKLASIMRRLGMCEELGTGWDRIVIECEIFQLPAPKIEIYEDSTKVTLYVEKSYTSMTPEDKLRACYLHACIKQVQGEQLTNGSLRDRFGLKDSSSGSISRLIKEAVEKNLIKPLDPDTAPRYMKYIPFWA